MRNFLIFFVIFFAACKQPVQQHSIVIQTDFGLKDGAVAEMKGIAKEVDNSLQLFDLTHEITAYNIWEAAYRLSQVTEYWPAGTVFVSVVDPGVGTDRKSMVAKTKSGQYIVTPDNGTLTLLARSPGIEAVREIDETINRRKGSERSYTFHGRDVYMYTAAKLASGKISFEAVGPELNRPVTSFPYQEPTLTNGTLKGNIPVLDIQYGNVWTNIPDTLLRQAGIKNGDSLVVKILMKDSLVCTVQVPLVNSFGDVAEGKSLGYFNSLLNFSVAVNMGSFAGIYGIKPGPDWNVEVYKLR